MAKTTKGKKKKVHYKLYQAAVCCVIHAAFGHLPSELYINRKDRKLQFEVDSNGDADYGESVSFSQLAGLSALLGTMKINFVGKGYYDQDSSYGGRDWLCISCNDVDLDRLDQKVEEYLAKSKDD